MYGELNRLLNFCRANNIDPRASWEETVKLYQGECANVETKRKYMPSAPLLSLALLQGAFPAKWYMP